jgi:hypothetical protein
MSKPNLAFDVAQLVKIRFHRDHVVISLATAEHKSIDVRMSLHTLQQIEGQIQSHYEKLWTQ